MDQKSYNLEDLSSLVEFCKKHKILSIEYKDMKLQMHASAFQLVDTTDMMQMREMLKEELKHEILEESQKQLIKESDEILYYSAV